MVFSENTIDDNNNWKFNINKQIFELDRLEQVQKDSLLRRAMYDSDYAQSNKIAVDQINEGMWQVQDTVNGTNTIFFDNEQRMTEWANTVGYSTKRMRKLRKAHELSSADTKRLKRLLDRMK